MKESLRHYWREHGGLWSRPLSTWATDSASRKPIWKPRAYDHNVYRDIETVIEKLNYCHDNPVRRGLVADPAAWRWSSYRFYEFGDRSVLAMDWDGRWPIEW